MNAMMATSNSIKQLSLNVYLDDDATFQNYFVQEGSSNHLALLAVQDLVSEKPVEPFIYLWGPEGVGVSHLLQAACHAAGENALRSQYLPLEELAGFAAEQLLDGLEQLDLVCLDGLQSVMGQPGWDAAMFHFYNRLRDGNSCRLLVSANCAPRDLGSRLPDLISRMGWGVAYHVLPLDDAQKMQALQGRAKSRGLDMGDDVAQFIITHATRDMTDLLACLDRIDAASMAEKRRVTIPFLKDIFNW